MILHIKITFLALLLFPSYLQAANWKQIHAEDSIVIYTKEVSDGVMPFKAIGVIHSPIAEILRVLQDHRQRPKWSPKLKRVQIHKMIASDHSIFSEYYKTPWPATDREFLLKGSIEEDEKGNFFLKAKSI